VTVNYGITVCKGALSHIGTSAKFFGKKMSLHGSYRPPPEDQVQYK